MVRIRIPYLNQSVGIAVQCQIKIFKRKSSHKAASRKSDQELAPYGEDVKMVRQHKLHCRLLSPAEQDEAVGKYKCGMTMTDIASFYGCSRTTILRLLRRQGYKAEGNSSR